MGGCLVTTREQTVLDLAYLPLPGEMPLAEVEAAIRALLPRGDRKTLDRIAAGQRLERALGRVQRMEKSR